MRDNGVALDDYFTKVEAMAAGVSAPPDIATPSPAASGNTTTPAPSTAAAAAPARPLPLALGAQDMFEKLDKLIAWRSAGHLSYAEFSAAKRALGLC